MNFLEKAVVVLCSEQSPKGWIYDYQTLVAGILAVVAAGLGITIPILREKRKISLIRTAFSSQCLYLALTIDSTLKSIEASAGFADYGFKNLSKIDVSFLNIGFVEHLKHEEIKTLFKLKDQMHQTLEFARALTPGKSDFAHDSLKAEFIVCHCLAVKLSKAIVPQD